MELSVGWGLDAELGSFGIEGRRDPVSESSGHIEFTVTIGRCCANRLDAVADRLRNCARGPDAEILRIKVVCNLLWGDFLGAVLSDIRTSAEIQILDHDFTGFLYDQSMTRDASHSRIVIASRSIGVAVLPSQNCESSPLSKKSRAWLASMTSGSPQA